MCNSKTLFSSILLIVCMLLLYNNVRAWERIISHCFGCGGDARGVVVDAAGDVIAIGTINSYEVVKMSKADGSVIWRFHAFSDPIEDLAVDSNGDVFVVAHANRSVVKVSGTTGTEIWRAAVGVTNPNAFQPSIKAVAVDRDNNVVTAGTVGGLLNISKLRGTNGTEMWRYEREGYAFDVAIDANGNVAAAGLMNRNFAAVRLDGANGSEIWQKEINGAGNFSDVFEMANAVAVDSGGNVIVAGITSNVIANFRDFTVAKYSPDGIRLWVRIIDGTYIQSNDIANAVVVDRDGDVIAAGSIENDDPNIPSSPREHFHVIKFSGATGNTIWSKSAQDAPFGEEDIYGHAFALSVNAYGNVVAAGMHGNGNNTGFTIVKFWGSTGGRAWRYTITSPSRVDYYIANDVVMDSNSDVIAAGQVPASDGWGKFTVVKLRREDGKDYSTNPTSPVPETVSKYAPLVYLHSDDNYRPGNPASFINESSLNWFHEGGCDSEVIADSVQADRLGELTTTPYTAKPTMINNSCMNFFNIVFKANDYTRPWDDNRKNYNGFWNDPFYQKEGFYLDLEDEFESQEGMPAPVLNQPGAPVFYEYVHGQYITYWFFYPYNSFKIRIIQPLPFPHIEEVGVQTHEGDWERISVQLNAQDLPVNIRYYTHDGPGEVYGWETVSKYELTHPIVFSAKGSHASYADEGPQLLKKWCFPVVGCVPDQTDDNGPKWSTWNRLEDIRSQSWYGYGGAWGNVSTLPFGQGKHFTGPLGPSTYKPSNGDWHNSIPTPAGQNVSIRTNSLEVNFSNISTAGITDTMALSQNQLPPLPFGYSLHVSMPMYDITTSAVFTGNITVSFNVLNVANATVCNQLRVLHYTNNAWDVTNNAVPSYDVGAYKCTLQQTVTSLSPFVVAQLIAPTAASVTVGGRVIAGKDDGVNKARVYLIDQNGVTRTTLTNPFGYYRFDEVPVGATYIFYVRHKRYQFNPQVFNVLEETNALDFFALSK